MPLQVAQRASPAMATTSTHKNQSPMPAAVPSSAAATEEKLGAHGAKVKHKRRFCRIEGCERIVKSQGLCQRHGAKPRLCKVDGCEKQAQGNFDGMCKSHFKEHKRKTTPIPAMLGLPTAPPEPEGVSVYDSILPVSVNFFPSEKPSASAATVAGATQTTTPAMPLVAHLAEGFHGGKPPAWHRNEERRARGLLPIQNPATQLEGWERELVWMEILILTGVPEVSFRHLARAWGRDKGFHMVLAQFICERHGDVQRKKRRRDDEYYEDEETAAAAAAEMANGNRGSAVAARKKSTFARQPQQEQQQPILPAVPERVPLMKRVSKEQMKEIRTAMLTPEGKKQMVSLLRRRSSDRNSSGDSSAGSDGHSLTDADWEETFYSDSNYNEALAADLFNLTEEESSVLRRRLSNVVKTGDDDSSSAYSRSAASKHLPPPLPPTGHQNLGPGASSTAAPQIPNTVKVQQAPDPEVDSLGPDHFVQQQAPLLQQPTPNQGYLQDSTQANQGIPQQEMQYVNIEEQNQFQDAEASLDYRASDGPSQQNPAPSQHIPPPQQQQQHFQQNFQQQNESHVQQQQQQQQQQHYHNAVQVPQHPVVQHQELAPKPDPQQHQYAHHGQHQPAQPPQQQPQAQQGYPLHTQPNILPNENTQSLHHRHHSIPGFSLHGQLPAQLLHHRQHSLQNFHLHGQPQAPPVQHQLHPQQHPLIGQSYGQANPQGQTQQSHPLQNTSNQPYEHVHHGQVGSNATFHQGQLAQQMSQAKIHQRQPAQPPRQPQNDDGDGLHDYDHHTEHLQAQDDEHLDPSHEHHDYGEEIEHEDHDHQDQGNAQQHAPQSQQIHHQAPGYQPIGGQPVHQQQAQHAIEQPHSASYQGGGFQDQQQQQTAYGQQQSVQQSYNSYQPPTQHGEASYEVPQQLGLPPAQHCEQPGQPPVQNFDQQGQSAGQHFEHQEQTPVQTYEHPGQQPPTQQQDAGTGQQDYNGYDGEQEALFELPYTTPANFQEGQNVDQQQPQDAPQQQPQQPMVSESQQQGYPQDPTQQQQSYQDQQHLQQVSDPQDHQNLILPQGQQEQSFDQQGTGNEFQYAEDSNYDVAGDQPNNSDLQYGNIDHNQGGMDGNGQHQGN